MSLKHGQTQGNSVGLTLPVTLHISSCFRELRTRGSISPYSLHGLHRDNIFLASGNGGLTCSECEQWFTDLNWDAALHPLQPGKRKACLQQRNPTSDTAALKSSL